MTVLLGDGRGAFAPAPGSPFPLGPRPGYVASGDLNGDLYPDQVATHDEEPSLSLLLGDGRGRFQAAPGSPLRLAERAWGAAIGDLNADNNDDLALGTHGNRGVVVWLGDGRGVFQEAAGSPFPAGRTHLFIRITDLNRDGRPDLLASNFESGDLSVLLAPAAR